MGNLGAKYREGPWELDDFLQHWVKGKDGKGDICKVSIHTGADEIKGTDLANAHLISTAPESVEFIADLMPTFEVMKASGLFDKEQIDEIIFKAENILKKAYNL